MGRRNRNSNHGRKSLLSRRPMTRAQRFQHRAVLSQRARGGHRNEKSPFAPPENWYEPIEQSEADYQIISQKPGRGYRHVLSPQDIRGRLSELPSEMLEPLEQVQLSRMTRKKQSFPCYGMQWGATLYLYPIEERLVEYYSRPPSPSQRNEANMYGGRWIQAAPSEWKLVWTESTIRDFYLNNILIHELGHLLDSRNSSYVDRERYAEWFAIEHGYRSSGGKARSRRKRAQKRHHAG